jgi:hypothetical protein
LGLGSSREFHGRRIPTNIINFSFRNSNGCCPLYGLQQIQGREAAMREKDLCDDALRALLLKFFQATVLGVEKDITLPVMFYVLCEEAGTHFFRGFWGISSFFDWFLLDRLWVATLACVLMHKALQDGFAEVFSAWRLAVPFCLFAFRQRSFSLDGCIRNGHDAVL